MAYTPEYQQRLADIDAQIAEIELLRTRQGDIPLPPKVPGKNASKEELQQYVRDQDAYENAVKVARQQEYDIDVLHGERKLTDAQARQENAYTVVSNKVGRAKQNVTRRASTANKWLANVPTPGGVWLPFIILMVLFLILFPVNGHSRMMWLFLVIIGQAQFQDMPGPISGDKKGGSTDTFGSGNTQVLYDQNTNPNQSPSQVVTSMPLPTTTPVSSPPLIPFTASNGTTGYLDSLFSTGF